MEEAWREMMRVMTDIHDPGEMEGLLRELLTAKEISDICLRWQLLKELHAGESQRSIAKRHGISLCKITRGSRILKAENAVCAKILDRLALKGQRF
ncbi:Trp family transcriptional regulator [Desulfobotulus sp.]|jgi:TrpR family trp operon transcriptional repressor|uniref:Trp family transcriptional regulator n=1 Tax=Desulfobotulus sp. TaxID=1940337 RepID=UPI002A35FBA7|nr:Trp family transcriptional regulator [Desulfobotulus sp.]MDY0163972.1 Trp family transcriptional regulator [Desulfobotulus sp.]